MPEIAVTSLSASPETIAMLSEILIETVANGGSVSFMHPLAVDTASGFWRGALAAALWTRGRAPGLYSMADVLGLSDG